MNPRDNTTSYTYDGFGHPTSVSTGSQTRQVAYDNSCTRDIGWVYAVSDAAGTTAYAYDAQRDITVRTFTLGTPATLWATATTGAGALPPGPVKARMA